LKKEWEDSLKTIIFKDLRRLLKIGPIVGLQKINTFYHGKLLATVGRKVSGLLSFALITGNL